MTQLQSGCRIDGATCRTSFWVELRQFPEAWIIAQRGPGRIDAQDCRGKKTRDRKQVADALDGCILLAEASLDRGEARLDRGSKECVLGDREKLHRAPGLAQ